MVDGELGVFIGVGLRLRFLAFCPDCGESVFELDVIGDVALSDAPELPVNVLRAVGGDLYWDDGKNSINFTS